jgi:hypothetical protein
MKRIALCVLLVAGVAGPPPARAGLFDDIYRRLDLVATPSGSPLLTASDGTRVNGQRSGRLRVVPDAVGRGYTLEFDRTFGVDSHGRPEVLDLGMYELELSGATTATLGFTRRGLTIADADFAASSLAYSLRAKTGIQDAELSGTLDVQNSLEINRLGFYTLNMNVKNANSKLTLDGVVVNDEQTKNFDIGPISVKGNIYFDGLVALLSTLGVDTTALQKMSPKSPIDLISGALQQQMNQLKLSSLVAGIQVTADGQLPPAPAVFVTPSVQPATATVAQDNSGSLVPEPGTLFLLASGGALLWGWRRR